MTQLVMPHSLLAFCKLFHLGDLVNLHPSVSDQHGAKCFAPEMEAHRENPSRPSAASVLRVATGTTVCSASEGAIEDLWMKQASSHGRDAS